MLLARESALACMRRLWAPMIPSRSTWRLAAPVRYGKTHKCFGICLQGMHADAKPHTYQTCLSGCVCVRIAGVFQSLCIVRIKMTCAIMLMQARCTFPG